MAPAGAVNLTTTNADVDGDTAIDTATSWGEARGDGMQWFLRLDPAVGGGSTVELGDLGIGYARVLDRFDLDQSPQDPAGSRRDEVLAIVGADADGIHVQVFGLDPSSGCAFRFDNGTDGAWYDLPVHTGPGSSSGIGCGSDAGANFLLRLVARQTDAQHWVGRQVRVQRTGPHSLADGAASEATYPVGAAELAPYAMAGCAPTSWVAGSGEF